jgi:hypothetical protein
MHRQQVGAHILGNTLFIPLASLGTCPQCPMDIVQTIRTDGLFGNTVISVWKYLSEIHYMLRSLAHISVHVWFGNILPISTAWLGAWCPSLYVTCLGICGSYLWPVWEILRHMTYLEVFGPMVREDSW